MESNIVAHFEYGRWHSVTTDLGKVTWRGALYPQDSQDPIVFADLLSLSARQIEQLLTACSGFFAFVLERSNDVIAAVDRIRSIPIFYSRQQRWLVSDSAEWIRQNCTNISPDTTGRTEFLLAGYVTGRNTLFEQIKQLQAGELAVFSADGLEARRYIAFDHEEPAEWSSEALEARLDEVSLRVFGRLTRYADGRPIIVPLSGGYDSRFVVTMLRRLGYQNVLCFSYGVPGNAESTLSQSIARSLGYEWTFAEYSDEAWRAAWSSYDAAAYRLMAVGHSSLPAGVQDWLAVRTLLARGELPPDGIVVPGHAGDFVAGSHIPDVVFRRDRFSKEDLIASIVNGHLSNAAAPSDSALLDVRRTLEGSLSDMDCESPVAFANAYEYWDWQERQAKYIANAVRTYDFFGLDWWMPLWDLEFMNYWRAAPLALRAGRAFFISFIQRQYAATAALNGPLPQNASDRPARRAIAQLLPRWVKDGLRRWIGRTDLHQHPLRFAALVPRSRLGDMLKTKHNIIGMYSRLYLEGEWGVPDGADLASKGP